MEIIFAKLSSIPLCDNCNTVVMAICTATTLLIIIILCIEIWQIFKCVQYIVCACTYVCIYVCVYVFPHCQPAYGGHSSTSLVCLVMWLIAIPLGLIIWQGSSRASCPLCLFYKPTIRMRNAYRQCKAGGGTCTWTRPFDPVPKLKSL